MTSLCSLDARGALISLFLAERVVYMARAVQKLNPVKLLIGQSAAVRRHGGAGHLDHHVALAPESTLTRRAGAR